MKGKILYFCDLQNYQNKEIYKKKGDLLSKSKYNKLLLFFLLKINKMKHQTIN